MTTVHRVVRKNNEVLAWQWTGQPDSEWPEWVKSSVEHRSVLNGGVLYIKHHLDRPCQQGDWLVNTQGDVYPIHEPVFTNTYEFVTNGEEAQG